MQQAMARLHRALAWITLAGLVLQVYLAGVGLFGAESLDLHRAFGMLLALPILLLPLVAAIGRLGGRLIGMSVALVALTVVQIVLPGLRSDLPWIAALHAVNALALMGLAANMARPSAASARPAKQQAGD